MDIKLCCCLLRYMEIQHTDSCQHFNKSLHEVFPFAGDKILITRSVCGRLRNLLIFPV